MLRTRVGPRVEMEGVADGEPLCSAIITIPGLNDAARRAGLPFLAPECGIVRSPGPKEFRLAPPLPHRFWDVG
jgi:hypothetical protein